MLVELVTVLKLSDSPATCIVDVVVKDYFHVHPPELRQEGYGFATLTSQEIANALITFCHRCEGKRYVKDGISVDFTLSHRAKTNHCKKAFYNSLCHGNRNVVTQTPQENMGHAWLPPPNGPIHFDIPHHPNTAYDRPHNFDRFDNFNRNQAGYPLSDRNIPYPFGLSEPVCGRLVAPRFDHTNNIPNEVNLYGQTLDSSSLPGYNVPLPPGRFQAPQNIMPEKMVVQQSFGANYTRANIPLPPPPPSPRPLPPYPNYQLRDIPVTIDQRNNAFHSNSSSSKDSLSATIVSTSNSSVSSHNGSTHDPWLMYHTPQYYNETFN